jgi:glutamyl-tRNA synthetase
MTQKPRVRFAPSPTGPLHMGGVRTALYNYLFAKKHGGDFILRIEDTDQNRYVPGSEEYIIESLKWAGIPPNEGVGFGDGPHKPYRQSERNAIYRKFAEELVEKGHAYYAFDTSQELEDLRMKMEASKSTFAYNSVTRKTLKNSLTLSSEEVENRLKSGESYVIRIKIPEHVEVHVNDIIRGEVSVDTSQLDDKVLFKSDGMPTYHLANVVDDYLMKITHVIRGEEWLPSAPLHVLLYRFFGWENIMPQFAHLPLLLKPDGNGKLSKRDGDRLGFPVFPLNWTDPITGEISSGYREKGYFPEAFVNMLSLLGWHPGSNQELFTIDQMINEFELDRVHKSGAKFDPEKTKWFNQQYLKKHSDEDLAKSYFAEVQSRMKEMNFKFEGRIATFDYTKEIVKITREKVQFVNEFWEKTSFFYIPPTSYDPVFVEKKWNDKAVEFFEVVNKNFENIEQFDSANTENTFKSTAATFGVKPNEYFQHFRILLVGIPIGPGLFDIVSLLGQSEVKKRIDFALQTLTKKSV